MNINAQPKSTVQAHRNSSTPSSFKKLLLTFALTSLVSTDILGQSPQTFNASGTFTVPAGVTSITIEAWGGGGTGSGNAASGTSQGGGGGGAYSKVNTLTVSAGQVYTINVGGSAQPSEVLSPLSTVVVRAAGGSNNSGQTGGAGGSSSSPASIGDVRFAGGSGATVSGNTGGGGGGSASSTSNGNNGSGQVGGSGINPGSTGQGGAGGSNNANGNPGTAPGAGGGGAGRAPGGSGQLAGAGASGRVVITYAGNTVPPVISGTPSNITGIEATSAAGAVVTYTTPTATDDIDETVTVTCSPASGSTFPIGNTTVTCSATDSSNNTTTTSFTVTVVDTTPPVITGTPSNITGIEATSAAGAVVTYTSPTATDIVDGTVTVTCTPASGSTFPIGITTVTCSATDSRNNTATTSFTVTVVDTTPPVIFNTPSNITGIEATSAVGAVVTYTSPTATDIVDGTVTVTCVPPSGSTFPIGITTVTCSATDSRNNATTTSFTVTVVDTTPPVITGTPSNITGVAATSAAGAVVTYTSPTATDIVDGPVTVTCVPPSGSTFPIGITTVTCSATDSRNNTTTTSFTVTVILPVPALPVDSVALSGTAAPGIPGATFNYFGDLSLNASGQCVIYARVAGLGITTANDAGIWILDGSGFNLMLREGENVGVTGQTIAEPLNFGRITDTGVTHLQTTVAGTGITTANNAIGWVDDGSTTRQFYRKGTTFSNLFNGVSQQIETGDGYFAGQLKTATGITAANDTGIWKINPADGLVSVAAREGTTVSGLVKVGNLMSRVAVGSSGFGVYPAFLTGTTSAQNRAILKQNFASAGAPAIVAQSNVAGSVSGVSGALFNTFQSESINSSGQVAFTALMVNAVAGVGTANDMGLWREAPGGIELVLREGQPVPNRPGVTFRIFTTHWLLTDRSVVVHATTSANDQGLWHINTAGVITQLIGFGQTIAEASNATFSAFYLRPDVSPSGKFTAAITLTTGTGGTTTANNRLLLVGDVASPGVFTTTLRSGQAYDVNGTTRTVRNFYLGFTSGNNATTTGGTGGMSRVINDNAQVALWLQFTDGTNGPFVGPALPPIP